jgi:hypothetical protein
MIFFLSFLFYKIGEQESRTGPAQGERVGTSGSRGDSREKGCKKCVHMHLNAKMIPVETIPGIGRVEVKGSGRGGEFKYDTVDTL